MSMDNQTMKSLVSIIMPAYNAAEFIEEAIRSVQNQTVDNWELLVIDDGSKDNTKEIVKSISVKDNRIRLLANEKNMGVAKSRNRGLDICRGNYVALLDSDDYWLPQLLEKLLRRIEETSADIAYCSYKIVDEHGNKLCNDFIVPEETYFDDSIVRNVISCSTVLMTRNVIDTYRFPTNMYHEDIALWFQMLRDGLKARGVTEVLAAHRQRSDSKTANKVKSACRRWVIYREYLKMPFGKTIVTMFRYAFYGVIKYRRI